jgi:hypothetical protein
MSSSLKKQARSAGWLYLLLAMAAPINLMYVLPALIVRGDASATASNIRSSQWLFHTGIVSALIGQATAILVACALYRLLKDVNHMQAVLMLALSLTSTAATFLNTLNEIVAFIILSGSDVLPVFVKPQVDALAFLFLRLHGSGVQAVAILWGLSLFPFGLLVFNSRFIPRILGVLLIISGFAYLVAGCTYFILPQYRGISQLMLIPESIGEPAIVLWLVIMGARDQPFAPRTPSPLGRFTQLEA